MKLVPPTISAIGRAMSEKLIAAPPMATSSTMAETKKCTSDEDDRTDTAWSSRLTISSYSCMCRSTPAERDQQALDLLVDVASAAAARPASAASSRAAARAARRSPRDRPPSLPCAP